MTHQTLQAVHAFGRAMTLSAKVQGLTDGNESAIPQPGSRLNRNHVLELYVHGVQSAVASLQVKCKWCQVSTRFDVSGSAWGLCKGL